MAVNVKDLSAPIGVTLVDPVSGLPVNGSALGMVTGSTVTRPNDTTAYASGDLVANSTTAGSVTPISFTLAAGIYDILDASLLTLSTSTTNASFRLHLYTSSPAGIANGDNGAWSTNKAGYVGALDITVDRAMVDGAFGRGLSLTQTPLRLTSTGTVYGLLEARAAYTPTAQGTFIASLTVG